ncbi:PREDICTED: glutathione S-transferase F13-like [Fragaria vesca subsp. vesca]|uniref:glutathione S-transferase F13-like n=1 Tax=Fragaria vesca subsp. vesca TaxID=101020 RepID=UPI0002C33D14|nr:PREDICTED: glutathione S-transferase F13-like [Fragaria vesca subsp. vesca]
MGLKLHGLALSTCTARVTTAIYEKGQEFELIPVNLTTGEHKQSGFLAKNPFGQIPALEDGDLTLFESRAIASYVAEKYKDSGSDLIRHNNLKEAALVKVWSEVEAQTFHPVISTIVHQHLILPLFGQQPDQAVIDANLEKLKNILNVYDARLKSSKYLAGDFFSIADLNHFPYLFYFMRSPWTSVVNDRPHVKAWWEDISSRPSFKKVAEGMALGQK